MKRAVPIYKYLLDYVPERLKMQEMCSEVMRINPAVFFLIPDHFKTQKTCIKVVEVQPWKLYYVPNHFMTQKMCNAAVSNDLSSLEYVSDWFVSQGLVKIWHDDNDYCKNELIKWHVVYQKRKAHKAKIKEELMRIAWHPSRWWDWFVSEDKKKQTEKLCE